MKPLRLVVPHIYNESDAAP